MVGKGNEDMFI